MIKKEIKYQNLFTEEEVTEDAYFHLDETALIELELGTKGGLGDFLAKTVQSGDSELILAEFKKIIGRAYGVREGDNFTQTPEISEAFLKTPAFNALFFELVTNPSAITEFILGMIPRTMARNPDVIKAMEHPELVLSATGAGMLTVVSDSEEPAWIKENRDPTPKEVREMSHEQLVEAYKRKTAREGPASQE